MHLVIFNDKTFNFYDIDSKEKNSQHLYMGNYDENFFEKCNLLRIIEDKPFFVSVYVKKDMIEPFLQDLKLLTDFTINPVFEDINDQMVIDFFDFFISNPQISINIYWINLLVFRYKKFSNRDSCSGCILSGDVKNCSHSVIETLIYPFSNSVAVEDYIHTFCRVHLDCIIRLSEKVASFLNSKVYNLASRSKRTLWPLRGLIDPYGVFA